MTVYESVRDYGVEYNTIPVWYFTLYILVTETVVTTASKDFVVNFPLILIKQFLSGVGVKRGRSGMDL